MSSVPRESLHHQLRLVRDDLADASFRRRRAVEREVRSVAARRDLDPNDPRWTLACRTRAELSGAALGPERRARLLGLATDLGIRPFDANLIIAIVQDEARRGERSDTLEDRLRFIPAAAARRKQPATAADKTTSVDHAWPSNEAIRRRRAANSVWLHMLWALSLGAALFLLALEWLRAGTP